MVSDIPGANICTAFNAIIREAPQGKLPSLNQTFINRYSTAVSSLARNR